jgi:hypothetical protein
MTKISLYQSVIDKQNAIHLCMDEDGVLDMDKFDLIEGTFIDRAVATIAVNKSMQNTLVGLKAQRGAVYAEYTREIDRVERNAQRLKDKLHEAMKTTGVMSVVSNDGMLSAKLLLEQDVSVELDEDQQFPIELCIIPAPTPSKTLIKAAILKGEPVVGARLVRKDRLTIK